MVTRDKATGAMPNLLLDELLRLPWGSLGSARLADFGSGPGFLIEHLAGRITSLTGIDWSRASLDMAAATASRCNVQFQGVHADIRDLHLEDRFDLIVSSNSVLPYDRRDVVKMLEVMRKHLAPGGQLYAILPSYDTTLYLQRLWRDHYLKTLGSSQHADRIVAAL
jgi:SAM-dependent methyltransferase